MHVEKALHWLKKAASGEAWGYLAGGSPRAEPTLHACAAGLSASLSFLQSADLGWTVLLAPAALSQMEGTEAVRAKCIEVVLSMAGNTYENVSDLDGMLVGWSWYPNSFSWLEPTAFAIVSLLRNGYETHPRVVEARELIRDRVCVDGGWNYGNKTMFGSNLLSYDHSTGWALLALPRGDALVPKGIERLRMSLKRPSTLNLSLATLAAGYHGVDPTPWADVLASRQDDDGSFGGGRVDRTALAVIALQMLKTKTSPYTGAVVWTSEQGAEDE